MIAYLRDTGCYTQMTLETYYLSSVAVMNLINRMHEEEITPYLVTPEDILNLVNMMKKDGYAPNTQNRYIATLRILLSFCKNDSFRKVRIITQHDTRPNVHWLTLTEGQRLLEYPFRTMYKVFIWLGLCHGLRRVEISRLKVSDIDMDRGTINVTGKGRSGGKLRVVPVHPNFRPIYEQWMKERKEIVGDYEVDSFAVHLRGIPVPYSVQALSSAFVLMSQECGIKFTAHTLRRTFGRELWHCGVSLETISTIFGHESTSTTIRYLGINIDDMTSAMSKLSLGR